MNRTVSIDLAKTYRADDRRIADDRRRLTDPDASSNQPAAAASRFGLPTLRRLILRDA